MKTKLIIHKITALLFAILLFYGCKKENSCDCIKRTGNIVFEKRQISGFDKLIIEDNVNVFITQDSVFEVAVEAGENLKGLVRTEVVDKTLFIKNKNRCNWTRSYKVPINVYIKMPEIIYITSDGTGNIKSLNTITTSVFDVRTKNSGNIELTINNNKIISHMHGAGDLTLHGYSDEHYCDIGGTAFLRCENLKTKSSWIRTFTTGICSVSASDFLSCTIDKIGDVVCYGNPATFEKSGNGSGQLYLK